MANVMQECTNSGDGCIEIPSGRSGGSIENLKVGAPMTESIQAEVTRTLSTVPVRASRQMTVTEYQFRVAEVLNLFDIEAVADETGVYYGDEGAELEDQPLLAAIRILIGRRFAIPEAAI